MSIVLVCKQLNVETFLFQTIQSTPGQSGPGSDGNEGVLTFPKAPALLKTSRSDCLVLARGVVTLCREVVRIFCTPSRVGLDKLVSYPGHSGSYTSAEIQSVYSAPLADWARKD